MTPTIALPALTISTIPLASLLIGCRGCRCSRPVHVAKTGMRRIYGLFSEYINIRFLQPQVSDKVVPLSQPPATHLTTISQDIDVHSGNLSCFHCKSSTPFPSILPSALTGLYAAKSRLPLTTRHPRQPGSCASIDRPTVTIRSRGQLLFSSAV